MKNRFVVMLALVLLAFASVSMAAENLPQSEVDEIVKGVESGDADAQLRLGLMYGLGQNVKQDYEQAVYWLKKSYQQGNVEAQFLLAILYYGGKGGIERDEAQAFKLMKQIAEKDPSSIKKLYASGIDDMYSSAEELVAAAECVLGEMYYYGRGVQKDYEQAEYWLKKSLEHGSSRLKKDAQELLDRIRAEEAKKSQTSTTSTASTQPKPQTQQSASESVIEIDLAQTVRECLDNNLVYKRKYDGKKVRVTEKIFYIGTNPYNKKIYIRLSYKDHSFDGGLNDIEDLYCYFEEDQADNVMKMKVNQRVTIEGTFKDYMPFSLEKCRIVNALQAASQASTPSVKTESTGTKTSTASTQPKPQSQPSASSLSKPRNFNEAKGNASDFLASVEEIAEKLMKTESYNTQDSENNGDETLYMRSWYNDRYFMLCYYANRPRPVATFRTYSPEFTFAGGIKVGSSFSEIRGLFGDFSSWSTETDTLDINVDLSEANIHITNGKIDYIEYNHLLAEYTHKMSNLLCLYRGDIYSAGITANGRLNIRDSNGTHGNILFQVTNQNNILFVDNSPKRDSNGNGWYRVRFVYNKSANTISSVNEGYVMGKYINVEPLGYEDRQSLITAFSK